MLCDITPQPQQRVLEWGLKKTRSHKLAIRDRVLAAEALESSLCQTPVIELRTLSASAWKP